MILGDELNLISPIGAGASAGGIAGGGESPSVSAAPGISFSNVAAAVLKPGPQRSLFFASLSTTKGASHAKSHRTAIELFVNLKLGGVDRDKTPGPAE